MFNESWKTQEKESNEWDLYEEDSLLKKLIIKLFQAAGIILTAGVIYVLIVIFLSFG